MHCVLELVLVRLSGLCVFVCLCYFGSRQCCCFPVVRWLDSREDYSSLEMCPLIHCCLQPSFFISFLPYLSYLTHLNKMPPHYFLQICTILMDWHVFAPYQSLFSYECQICTGCNILLMVNDDCCSNNIADSKVPVLVRKSFNN